MNSQTKPALNPRRRHWARQFALQALYQWSVSQSPVEQIAEHFSQDENVEKADWDYFQDLLTGTLNHIEAIDQYIHRYIDRKIAEIDLVELSILRYAIYELMKRPDVPGRVVLNEALELAKTFGATDGYKFVNGILDKVSREIRFQEMNKSHG